MTEKEAIEKCNFMNDALNFQRVESDECSCALQMAIAALEEIQKYHAIGTVEECRCAMNKQLNQNLVEVEEMGELIKRQDAINAVMQNYCYESDRMTALQELPVITDEKIRNEAIINYSVAVLAEVAERAKQEDAPIYEGDKEVDQWVRLSDVEEAINKYLN